MMFMDMEKTMKNYTNLKMYEQLVNIFSSIFLTKIEDAKTILDGPYEDKDIDKVTNIFHSLKGQSATIYFSTLSNIFLELEKNTNKEFRKSKLEEVRAIYAQTLNKFSGFLNAKKNSYN